MLDQLFISYVLKKNSRFETLHIIKHIRVYHEQVPTHECLTICCDIGGSG